ncbi:MAG: ATP-binding cassette domain-containing protein, partial [Bosea sp. (in: a-proteobacteria)]
MLSFENLSKTYADGTQALADVTVSVGAGEILALVGGSGCGKTTLLRLVAGLDQPSAGRIRLEGEAITEPRADVGVIFQEPRLFPWLSVADNVAFGLSHLSAFAREGLVANALVRVGLGGYETRWPRELSGG